LGEGSVRAENTSTAGADHNDGVQYVLERMPPDWRSWCLACDPGPCDPMYDLDAFIETNTNDYLALHNLPGGPDLPETPDDLDTAIDELAGAGAFGPQAQALLHQLSNTVEANSSETLAQYQAQVDQLDMNAEPMLMGSDLPIL